MIDEHEELLADAFRAFTRLERMLRHRIGETLNKKLGTQWTVHLPLSIRERLEEKSRNVHENMEGPNRYNNLLNYADFSELISIVDYYWEDAFKTFFSDREVTRGLFETVRSYRNALMHSVLLPSQCPIFISMCNELIQKMDEASKEIRFIPPVKTDLDVSKPVNLSRPSSEEQEIFHKRISTVLKAMTGLFEGEYTALVDYLARHLNLCTDTLLSEIRLKFAGLPEANDRIDALSRRLPPEKPKHPGQDMSDINKWLKWAATSYLPYRFWMMINGQTDKDLEAMSLVYEDWLYRSYPHLLIKFPERFVFGSYHHINRYLQKDKKVLWVLIDNLPLFYLGRLTRQLNEYGFRVTELVRQISMLPSFTEVSRISALAGRPHNQIPKAVTEEQIVGEVWTARTSKNIVWLEDIQALENASQYQADLFIYVYGRLDRLWHTPDNKDFDREEEIESALDNFLSKLSKSFNKLAQKDPTILILSTDHGSVYLPSESEKLTIPPSAIKDAAYEKHRRFVSISGDDALNKDEWFYLDKDTFHLHQSYAVARGWRFIGERTKSYTHGGLSPEETIVPLLILEMGETEFERLQPLYEQASDPMRLGRPSKLIIRVRNPYQTQIENLEITLSDFGLTFPPIDVEPQMEATTSALELALPSKIKVEQDNILLNINTRFTTGNQQRTQMAVVIIKIKRLFAMEFDDDFGAMLK